MIASDAASLQKIIDSVRDNYRGVLIEKRETVVKVYQSSETDEVKLQSTYQSLVENLSKKEEVLVIERRKVQIFFELS